MTAHPKKIAASRFLARFLTLLSFFHFAGLNNGYTAMMAAAPHPVLSAFAAADLAGSAFSVVRVPLTQTFRSSQKLIINAVAGAQKIQLFAMMIAGNAGIESGTGSEGAVTESELRAAPISSENLAPFAVSSGQWERVLGLKQEHSLQQRQTLPSPRGARGHLPIYKPVLAARGGLTRFQRDSTPRFSRAARKIIGGGESGDDAPMNLFVSTWHSPSQSHSGAATRVVVFWGQNEKIGHKAVSL